MMLNNLKNVNFSENVSLLPYNTFRVEASARYWGAISSTEAVQEAFEFIQKKSLPYLILGGGSNILFTQNFEGVVLKNELKGIEVEESPQWIKIKAYSGEIWHDIVELCVNNDWGGIENLALIPGTVGAAPIQNIGAYGVELKDVLHTLTAFHIPTRTFQTFSNSDCQFGYRDSIFKSKFKNQFFILQVVLKLPKPSPLNLSYPDLQKYFDNQAITPSIRTVFEAVVHIRKKKLPDPALVGNAGSFFKNPILPFTTFQSLQKKYPHLPFYPLQDNTYKVPAAWLIEQCGWKGYREKDFGVHPQQALVLVNYHKSTGKELLHLAQNIIQSVKQKFDILLEPEVNIY